MGMGTSLVGVFELTWVRGDLERNWICIVAFPFIKGLFTIKKPYSRNNKCPR